MKKLPKVDDNNILERRSVKALSDALPETQFFTREEGRNDYGVDMVVELIAAGEATNIRSAVQLKATGETELNQDGSVSLSVDVANLNYLLNQQASVYVLYLADTGQLRFAWARDQAERLQKSNPKWADQQTCTLRFSEILDANTVGKFSEHILREATFAIDARGAVAKEKTTSGATLLVDPSTLKVATLDDIERTLKDHGFELVVHGYAARVRELFRKLESPEEKLPVEVVAASAFACYEVGHFDEARRTGRVAQALGGLADEPAAYLQKMLLSCDHELGRISVADYFKKVGEFPEIAWDTKLNGLRHRLGNAGSPQEVQELYRTIDESVQQIMQLDESKRPLKVFARTLLAEARCWMLNIAMADQNLAINLAKKCGLTIDLKDYTEDRKPILKLEAEFEAERNALFEDAKALKHPLFLADLLLSLVEMEINFLAYASALNVLPPEAVRARAKARLESTDTAIVKLDSLNVQAGLIRARCQRCELLLLIGERKQAQVEIKDVVTMAEARENARHLPRARQIQRGETTSVRIALITPGHEGRLVHYKDTDLVALAKRIASLTRLSVMQMPAILKDLRALRSAMEEKRDWCMHLDVQQHRVVHFDSKSRPRRDIYPDLTGLRAVCLTRKLGPESSFVTVQSSVEDFKVRHCNACDQRASARSQAEALSEQGG